MINIYLFIITFILINIYLVYENNLDSIKNISPLISNQEIIICIDIIVVIYILIQYYIYYTFSSTNVRQISNFTSNISENSITIDLSNNKNINNYNKIIYWIVNNINGGYNNYELNGIVKINNGKVTIPYKNMESFDNLELRYRCVLDEKLDEMVYSVKIK